MRQLRLWVARGRHRRRAAFLAFDAVLLVVAMSVAVSLGFPERTSLVPWTQIAFFGALSLTVKLPILQLFRLYDVSWRYVGVRDLVSLAAALTMGTAALIAMTFIAERFADRPAFATAGLVIDYLMSLVLLGGFLASRRVAREWLAAGQQAHGTTVLIVGAGDAGEQVARRLREDANTPYRALGFVDDDPAQLGSTIHGVRVLGPRDHIPRLAVELHIDEMWIAMPSASGAVRRETVALGWSAGFKHVKFVPGLGALLNGQVRLADLREVQPADMLGRQAVHIDTAEVNAFLAGKRVLVSGAAGSIGSELCRQVAEFGPSSLGLLDHDETGVFNIQNALKVEYPLVATQGVVANVCDEGKVSRVFESFQPDVVLHAAAYKHVPLMELHPDEAIRTNVLGTQTMGLAAVRWGVSSFVLISTDKAVNPTSVMGATKRAAEVVVQELNRVGVTRFVAVRFGNVLGSRGSVVPIFQEQIRRGGPVTVTHPEMQRYFMTTEEAVLLVLQAATIGRGGEVLVLDMGEPVKIIDLARQLITLSGYEPDRDIPIVFTGPRPGEKLFEDILTAEEGTTATRHERVFVARGDGAAGGEGLGPAMIHLQAALRGGDKQQMVAALRRIVPTFNTNEAEPTAPAQTPTPPRLAEV